MVRELDIEIQHRLVEALAEKDRLAQELTEAKIRAEQLTPLAALSVRQSVRTGGPRDVFQ
jgi:hypothetical protein